MKALDFTDGSFDAAHKGQFAEQVHGHTWKVRIFWNANPPRDAKFMKARLRQYLEAAFDHRMLDDVIDDPTNFGVAKALLALMGPEILKIIVWRDGNVDCGVEVERPAAPLNRYCHDFVARCPENGIPIAYRLTIEAASMIRVEDIVAACSAHLEGFHEAIADDLARLGGVQILVAHHHGVDIETRRGG